MKILPIKDIMIIVGSFVVIPFFFITLTFSLKEIVDTSESIDRNIEHQEYLEDKIEGIKKRSDTLTIKVIRL